MFCACVCTYVCAQVHANRCVCVHTLTQSPSVSRAPWFCRSLHARIYVLGRLPGAGGHLKVGDAPAIMCVKRPRQRARVFPSQHPWGPGLSLCNSTHTDPGVEPHALLPTVRRGFVSRARKAETGEGVSVSAGGSCPGPSFLQQDLKSCLSRGSVLSAVASDRSSLNSAQAEMAQAPPSIFTMTVYPELHGPRWLVTPQDLN